MNARCKHSMTSIVGALTGTAGALLLAAIVVPSDPLGRSIGALLAGSLAVGIVGALIKASALRSGRARRGPKPSALPFGMPSAPAALARVRRSETVRWNVGRAEPDFGRIASLTAGRVGHRHVASAPCEALEA